MVHFFRKKNSILLFSRIFGQIFGGRISGQISIMCNPMNNAAVGTCSGFDGRSVLNYPSSRKQHVQSGILTHKISFIFSVADLHLLLLDPDPRPSKWLIYYEFFKSYFKGFISNKVYISLENTYIYEIRPHHYCFCLHIMLPDPDPNFFAEPASE